MPSSELESIVEQYDVHIDSPKGRMEVCDKLAKLGDPEAIPVLAIIYKEDVDKGVREKAGESLKIFRAQQRRLERELASPEGGAGYKRLQTLFTVTLVLLILANVGLFVTKPGEDTETDAEQRQRLADQIAGTLDGVISDSLGLQTELRKLKQENELPNCQRNFIRPQQIQVTSDKATKFPELAQLVTNDVGFSMGYLEIVFGFWDTICKGGRDLTNVTSNLERLNAILTTATAARSNPLIKGESPLSRTALLGQISTTLDTIILDTEGLQTELQKVGLNTPPDCSHPFARPQPITLSPDENAQYPDIQTFMVDEVDFALRGLNVGLDFWYNSVCGATAYQPADATANGERLSSVLSAAITARDSSLPNLLAAQP